MKKALLISFVLLFSAFQLQAATSMPVPPPTAPVEPAAPAPAEEKLDMNVVAALSCKITEGATIGYMVSLYILENLESKSFAFTLPVIQYRVFDLTGNIYAVETSVASEFYSTTVRVWDTKYARITIPSDATTPVAFEYQYGKGTCGDLVK